MGVQGPSVPGRLPGRTPARVQGKALVVVEGHETASGPSPSGALCVRIESARAAALRWTGLLDLDTTRSGAKGGRKFRILYGKLKLKKRYLDLIVWCI